MRRLPIAVILTTLLLALTTLVRAQYPNGAFHRPPAAVVVNGGLPDWHPLQPWNQGYPVVVGPAPPAPVVFAPAVRYAAPSYLSVHGFTVSGRRWYASGGCGCGF